MRESFKEAEQKIKDIFKSMEETELNKDTTFENKDMIKAAETAKDKYFSLKAKPKPAKKEEKKTE